MKDEVLNWFPPQAMTQWRSAVMGWQWLRSAEVYTLQIQDYWYERQNNMFGFCWIASAGQLFMDKIYILLKLDSLGANLCQTNKGPETQNRCIMKYGQKW